MMNKEKYEKCEEVFGSLGRSVLEKVETLSPRIVNLVHDYFANNLYADNTLDPKTRELVVTAVIATLGGMPKPLTVHVKSALAAGCSQEEIVAVLETVASYAGMPKAISGLLTAKEVFEEVKK